MPDLPERGPLGFRPYPWRLEHLRTLQVEHDKKRPPVEKIQSKGWLPIPPALDAAIRQYIEEDDAVDRYGWPISSDWVFFNEAGPTIRFTDIVTYEEAIYRAEQIWTAFGHKFEGIRYMRRLRTVEKKEG